MIEYRRGGLHSFLNMFRMRGSVFPVSFVVACPCAVVTGIMKYLDLIQEQDVLTNNTAWSGFSFLVGFLVVFRTSQAYSRFWDGATSTHRMRAEWCDAASAIVAFTKHSKADAALKSRFSNTLLRLFSLLHAMALGELEGNTTEAARFRNFEIIDAAAFDSQSWRALEATEHKVALVFQWIQGFIVENISTGVLTIPPPILSRAFQELANGMVAHHEAMKIAEIPFPFPYAQACDCLLIMHWLLTPIITVQYTANVFSAFVFCFVQVFILWSLTNIAVEIEHPFGDDANDLNAEDMQNDMNEHLLLQLNPSATRSPFLTEEALMAEKLSIEETGEVRKRGAFRSYKDVCKVWDARGVPEKWVLQITEPKEKMSEPAPAAAVALDVLAAKVSTEAPSSSPQTFSPSGPPPALATPVVPDPMGSVGSLAPPTPVGAPTSSCASTAAPTPAGRSSFSSAANTPHPSSAQDSSAKDFVMYIEKDTCLHLSRPPKLSLQASLLAAAEPKIVPPSPNEFAVAADATWHDMEMPRASIPPDVSVVPASRGKSWSSSAGGGHGRGLTSGEPKQDSERSSASQHSTRQRVSSVDTVSVPVAAQMESEMLRGSCFSCAAPQKTSIQPTR